MKIALVLLVLWLLTYETWVRYVAIMSMKDRVKELYPVARFHAYVALVDGVILDVALNLTLGCLLFARLPGLIQATAVPVFGLAALYSFPGIDLEWLTLGIVVALFAEPPSPYRLLLTARLSHHIRNSQGTRHAKVAGWLCSRFLDQFDEGHCG